MWILRELLGVRPDAAAHRLVLDRPVLPPGVTYLTVTGLRVGEATVDLRVTRDGHATRTEVTGRTGDLVVAVRA